LLRLLSDGRHESHDRTALNTKGTKEKRRSTKEGKWKLSNRIPAWRSVTNPDNASVGNSYDEMLDALFAFFLLFAFLVFLRDLVLPSCASW